VDLTKTPKKGHLSRGVEVGNKKQKTGEDTIKNQGKRALQGKQPNRGKRFWSCKEEYEEKAKSSQKRGLPGSGGGRKFGPGESTLGKGGTKRRGGRDLKGSRGGSRERPEEKSQYLGCSKSQH